MADHQQKQQQRLSSPLPHGSLAQLSVTAADSSVDQSRHQGSGDTERRAARSSTSNGSKRPRRTKRKAMRACTHCQRSHLTCDNNRPCARCVKRGLGPTCVDGVRKTAKYLVDPPPHNMLARTQSPDSEPTYHRPAPLAAQENAPLLEPLRQPSLPHHQQQQHQQHQQQITSSAFSRALGLGAPIASPIDPNPTEPAAQQSTPTITSFGSEAINLEYAIMSNMLTSPMFASNVTGALGSPVPDGTTSTISIPNSLWATPATSTAPLLPPLPQQQQQQQQQQQRLLPTSPAGQAPLPAQPSSVHDGVAGESLGFAANNNSAPTNPLPMPPQRQMSWQGPLPALPHAQDMEPQGTSNNSHSVPPALASQASHSSPPIAQIVMDDTGLALSRPPTSAPAVQGLNPVYAQSPADVYSSVTEPYKYHIGFHFFFEHIGKRMSRKDILRVSRAIAHFRPSLVALLRNLTREDLIFMEKSLRRAMLEYEKLIGFTGTPTVVWRRTGEIVIVGKEFSILTHWDRSQLTAGNRFIFELMDTESAVTYWEQFAVHAFENSEHAVMSECRLVRSDGAIVPCAFSFTIKRDLFGIPMAIVGNFLPIL